MNQQQAIAAMKKLWGKNAAWRRNEDAPVGEAREAILATVPALREAERAAKAARDARRAELLRDPEYQRLVAEANAASKAADKAASCHHWRRVTVGYCSDVGGLGFFHVKGQGDNWQEAIDAARAAK